MMKRPLQPWGRNDPLLLWLACVVALCAGYYVAFGLLAAAIDLQASLTGRISTLALADAQILAQRPTLEREGRAVDDRLRNLQLHADKSTTVARFINAAARIAAAQRVNLVQIDELGPAAGVLPPASRTTLELRTAFAFEGIPLEVILTGSYRELLATIRNLAQAPVTMQIEVAAIERSTTTTGSGENGPLTARLHVVLQRLSDAAPLVSGTSSLPEDTTVHARPF